MARYDELLVYKASYDLLVEKGHYSGENVYSALITFRSLLADSLQYEDSEG